MRFLDVDLDTLDISEVGSWPKALRGIAAGVICALVLILGFFLVVMPQFTEIDDLRNTKQKEKLNFATKYEKASNIDAYKTQMVEIQKMYADLLHELPSRNNVETLNKDLSEQANASGLSVLSFKPGEDQIEGFYGARALHLSLEGTYNNFGDFASSVANMERIVTTHDFTITAKVFTEDPKADKVNQSKLKQLQAQYPLNLELDAKTYWYIGDETKK